MEGLELLKGLQAMGFEPWQALVGWLGWQYLKGNRVFHADFKKHIEQTEKNAVLTNERLFKLEYHQKKKRKHQVE